MELFLVGPSHLHSDHVDAKICNFSTSCKKVLESVIEKAQGKPVV